MSLNSTGSSNAFAVTPNRTIASLADGLTIGFTANHSITGAATLNVSGLGARPIVSSNGSALASGDIVSGQKLQVVYRSATADFQVVGDRASGTSADMTARVFPVGGIIPWPTSTAPTGWLLAYGQAVSRTTYVELFAVYGTTYGSGDGSTTFNVPDYRGRVPFGKDDMGGSAASRLTSSFGPDGTTLGATGGAQSTTLTEGNIPSHTHSFSATTSSNGDHSHTYGLNNPLNAAGGVSASIAAGSQFTTSTAGAHTHTVSGTTGATGSGTAFSNVPPGIVQNWIILALPATASAATTGVNGLLYQWSTGTTDTNPGSGKLALNNATVASATQLYISETDAAGAGMGPVLALWDDSTSTIKGTLYIYKVGSLLTFAAFTISGTMTDGGAYDKFTLTHVASGGTFVANDQLAVLFVPKGDKGDSAQLATDTTWQAKGDLAVATGNDTATILTVGADGTVLVADSAEATGVRWAAVSGTGDVTAASAFATDNRLIRSDGTGKGVQASGVTVDDSANVSGIAALSATTVELGHASDTTLARSGAGDITIEGNAVYRAGGTDVPIADGGTGASTAAGGFRALAEGISTTQGAILYRDGSQWSALAPGVNGQLLRTNGAAANPSWVSAGGTGDVVGPASTTDNAVARFDATTGKLIQNSGVIIDDSNNVSGVGTLANGTQTTTSTNASALAVGANGATNPVLKINASTALVATGVEITGAAAAARVALAAISSGTDEGLSLDAKGSGTIRLGATSTGAIEFSRPAVPTSSDGAALGTSALMWSDLFLASGAVVNFNNGNVTLTHAAGSLTVAGATTVSLGTSAALTTGTIELGHATANTLSAASGDLSIEGTVLQKAGKQTIWVPAAAMTARTTNGAASGTTELATNDIMLRSFDFDTTTEEGVGFMIAMPKSWNESTVTFKAFWTAASGSGGVAWGLAGYALSDDDAMDTAVSGQQIVTDTLLTANDMHITAESSAITIGGTPAEGDVVYFEITREVANGSDTLAVDARLIGIHLYITTNASTDA
jgi:microcystin-dependent protein